MKVVDSDRCPECETRDCDAIAGVRDRELVGGLLQPGERSELFISSSKIQQRYGAHQVHFFYLRVDDEIARVEMPKWVADDDGLLNLTHALVLDQCRRGHGYPVALSEAHEKAVVTGADAESFWRLVESSLVEEHLPVTGSAKNRSKRTRWV
jgi:NurA-like 5'-3' nuclease